MVEVIVKLNEDDVNILRRLLINEIELLECDKERCYNDVNFKIISENLDSHINATSDLCKRICKAYNDEVIY